MSENWDFYPCLVEGEPASIMVNLGLAAELPVDDLTDCVWLRVQMQQPRSDGRSSSAEFDRLCAMGDALDATVAEATTPLRYAGRCTCGGRRDFYAYAESGLVGEAVLSSMMTAFPEYEFETGFRSDPEWRLYADFLYPTEPSLQLIRNRRVLEALEKAGDPLSEPRPICHFAHFVKAVDADAFCQTVEAEGFVLISRSVHDGAEGEPTHIVVCERTDSVEFIPINNLTSQLLDFAKTHGGNYDGWETQVRRPVDDEPTGDPPTDDLH